MADQLQLQRVIASQLFLLVAMTAAREMFGKSWFALGVGERAIVEQMVVATVRDNTALLTDEALPGLFHGLTGQDPAPAPMGFAAPKSGTTK